MVRAGQIDQFPRHEKPLTVRETNIQINSSVMFLRVEFQNFKRAVLIDEIRLRIIDFDPSESVVSINNQMVILWAKKLVLPKLMLSTPTIFQPINAPSTPLAHATLHLVHTKTTMTPMETATSKKNFEVVLHSKKRTNVIKPVSNSKV